MRTTIDDAFDNPPTFRRSLQGPLSQQPATLPVLQGPFSATQILNWYKAEWYDKNLKIRRIGSYWTRLGFVLEELKAEDAGHVAAPAAGSGYHSTPTQVEGPRAVAVAAKANGGFPAADDGWGSGSTATTGGGGVPAPAGWEEGGWGHAPAAGRGGGGHNQDFGARGFGVGKPTGVPAGRWERGQIIDRGGGGRGGAMGGGRGPAGRDAYGGVAANQLPSYGEYDDEDEYGAPRRGGGRGRRGGRGGRGGGRFGGAPQVNDYDRILEGGDDMEYGAEVGRGRGGGRGRGRGRAEIQAAVKAATDGLSGATAAKAAKGPADAPAALSDDSQSLHTTTTTTKPAGATTHTSTIPSAPRDDVTPAVEISSASDSNATAATSGIKATGSESVTSPAFNAVLSDAKSDASMGEPTHNSGLRSGAAATTDVSIQAISTPGIIDGLAATAPAAAPAAAAKLVGSEPAAAPAAAPAQPAADKFQPSTASADSAVDHAAAASGDTAGSRAIIGTTPHTPSNSTMGATAAGAGGATGAADAAEPATSGPAVAVSQSTGRPENVGMSDHPAGATAGNIAGESAPASESVATSAADGLADDVRISLQLSNDGNFKFNLTGTDS